MVRPIFSTNMNKHVGLNEASQSLIDNSLTIYPNPTTDFIIISPNYFGYNGVVIYDIQGKIVCELNREIIAFSSESWSKGIYLMKDNITGRTYKISKQ